MTQIEKMSVYEVVKKLTGPISPVGETNEDERRLKNLTQLLDLTRSLLSDISDVSEYKDRVEYSMKIIGKEAHSFLKLINDEL